MAKPFVTMAVRRVGMRSFQKRLNSLDAALTSAASSKEIGDVLVSRIKERMTDGKDAENKPHKKLKPRTLRWRRWAVQNPAAAGYGAGSNLDPSAHPLMFSGRLRDSIKVSKGSEIRINTGSGFRITADAKSDNDGHAYGREQQRLRPFLRLNADDADVVVAKMARRLRLGA